MGEKIPTKVYLQMEGDSGFEFCKDDATWGETREFDSDVAYVLESEAVALRQEVEQSGVKIAELENDLSYSNSTREALLDNIRGVNEAAGVPSLSHVQDLVEMIIEFYAKEIISSRADKDLNEALAGIKNELEDSWTRAKAAEAELKDLTRKASKLADRNMDLESENAAFKEKLRAAWKTWNEELCGRPVVGGEAAISASILDVLDDDTAVVDESQKALRTNEYQLRERQITANMEHDINTVGSFQADWNTALQELIEERDAAAREKADK